MIIPWGEYMPDLSEQEGPHLIVAQNVVPIGNGYKPAGALAELSTGSTTDDANHAIACRYGASSEDYFVGTATGLYRSSNQGTSFADVSKAGGYTAATWDFAQFGNVLIGVAGSTSTSDVPQAWTLGSSSAFANLAGSPPRASCVAVVRDFVVMANTYDATDGVQPCRVRWSGFGDETAWAINPATQADLQDLKQEGGPILAVTGGAYGTIFQDTIITRMSYEGPPTVFRLDTLATGIGIVGSRSAVRFGGVDYWHSQTGFMAMDSAGGIKTIGEGRVDLTAANSAPFYAVAVPKDDSVYWFTKTGLEITAHVYNVKYDRWTTHVFSGALYKAGFVAYSGFTGGRLIVMTGSGTSRRPYYMTASPAAFVNLRSAFQAYSTPRRTIVNRLRFIGDGVSGSDVAANVLAATDPDASATSSAFSPNTDSQSYTGRAEGRVLSVDFSQTEASATRMLGYELIDAKPSGMR